MNSKITHASVLKDEKSGLEGRPLGPFVRKGEQWWTIYWQDGTTTSEREKDMLGGQET